MWKLSIATVLILGLLAAASFTVPGNAFAQDAQYNESDLDFAQRMMARLDRIDAQADKLEEMAGRKKDSFSEQSNRSQTTSMQQDDFGRSGAQSRISSVGTDEYQRTKLELRSIQRKAKKEREKLTVVQGSKSRPEDLDREEIESNVARMERDLEYVDRDLRRR